MKVVAADCPFLSHSNQLLFSGLCFHKLLTKHNEKEPTWQVFDCSCFPLKPDLRLSLFLQPTKLSVTFTHFLFIFFIYQIIFFSIQRNDPFYCICYSKKPPKTTATNDSFVDLGQSYFPSVFLLFFCMFQQQRHEDKCRDYGHLWTQWDHSHFFSCIRRVSHNDTAFLQGVVVLLGVCQVSGNLFHIEH